MKLTKRPTDRRMMLTVEVPRFILIENAVRLQVSPGMALDIEISYLE